MAESFQEKRRKELGVGGESGFQTNRMMDLGMIEDTRPVPGSNLTRAEYKTYQNLPFVKSPMGAVHAFTDRLQAQTEAAAKSNPPESAGDWFFDILGKPAELGMRAANRVGDFLGLGRGLAKSDPERFNEMPDFLKTTLSPIYKEAETPAEKAADFTGEAIGYIAPTSAAYKLVGKTAIKSISSPLVRRLVSGLAAEGSVQAAKEIAEGSTGLNDQTLGERALDVGLAGGIGGVTTGFGPIIGEKLAGTKLGQAVKSYFTRKRDDGPVKDLFDNLDAAEDIQPTPTVSRTELSPVLGPTVARIERRPGLSAVMEQIRPIVTERMTPPYENPNELAKWVRENLGDPSVSLNEVRALPYEYLRQLAEEMKGNLSTYEMAVQVAREKGHDLEKLLNPRKIDPDLVSRARERQGLREMYGVHSPVRSVSEAPSPIAQQTPDLTATSPYANVAPDRPAIADDIPELDPDEIPFDVDEPSSGQIPDEAYGSLDEPDAVLPIDEEVAPRVRDRLHSFADKMIEDARKEIAASRNRLSSNPLDLYAQFAKIGAGYVLKGVAKSADFFAAMMKNHGAELRREFQTNDIPELRKHVTQIFKLAKEEEKGYRSAIEREQLGLDQMPIGQELKDIRSINLNTGDPWQNFKKVFGKHYEGVKRAVLDPFDEAKAAYVDEQKQLSDSLYNDIVQKYGFMKGSKESALIQKYGEQRIDLAALQQEAPDQWQNIVDAADWFRNQYDMLIDKVNATIAKIYPNKPEKIVPKRKDYFRHFQDQSLWRTVSDLFDVQGSQIDPHLEGISPNTKPKTKWASFKQRRGLGEFKDDAVGGFLNYIPSAAYAIHIDPHISVFRNLAKHIADDTSATKNLNNFKRWLERFANELAGKSHPGDETGSFHIERKGMRVLSAINSRTMKNTLLGSFQTMIAQAGSLPQGLSHMGVQNIPIAAVRTLKSAIAPNPAMQQSKFLRERYLNSDFRKFDRWWEKPESTASAMMEAVDRVGTSMTWNGAYLKALRAGADDPVKVADEETRRLIGGTGIGEIPLTFRSQLVRFLLPFQRDLNTTWRALKSHVDKREYGALAMFAVYSWIINEAAHSVTGKRPFFDPIEAFKEAVTEDDIDGSERFGRVAGEVLSNLPAGQVIAGLYPEAGVSTPYGSLPTRSKFFGESDPTRFGEAGLVPGALNLIQGDVTDPLFKLALPFGGAQLKRTIQGIDALAREGSYTENVITTGPKIEEPKLRFPVATSPMNVGRAVLFGPYATTEGKEYIDEKQKPLSERQTKIYQNHPDPESYFKALQEIRKRKASN